MNKNIKFYSYFISIILILFGTGLLSTNSISLAQGGTWITKKNMPTKRYGLSASVLGGKIYAIGGSPSASTTPAPPPLATVEVYDPVTDTWDTTKAPMPTARKWLCSSVVNGKIYAIGGGIYGESAFNIVEEYDPMTDTWTKKKDMPTARALASSAVVDGKIYVIGGESALHGLVLAAVEEYDPVTDTWTKKANMPFARFCIITEVVGDKIYVIGGADSTYATLDLVQVYDPVTDKWSEAADMPTARVGLCGGEINDKIYAIGGMRYQGFIFYSTVEEYDPALNIWKKMLDMPTKRFFPASGVVDGKIYVMGGVQEEYSPAISVVEEYTPQVTEGFIAVSHGLQIYYRVIGNDPDTVVIPLDCWWHPHVAPLASNQTLILYDPRDRGRSDAVPDPSYLSMYNEIYDLEAIRSHFKLAKMNLIGWSYLGAMVALYTVEFPDHVKQIIQVCPASPRKEPFVSQTFADMANRVDSTSMIVLQKMKEEGIHETDPIQYCRAYWKNVIYQQLSDTTVMSKILKANACQYENEWPQNMGFGYILRDLGNWDWREKVGSIKARVLVIHGAEDNFPLQSSQEWASNIPNAHLLVIEGAGHYPQVERPDVFFKAVKTFLNGNWPASVIKVE